MTCVLPRQDTAPRVGGGACPRTGRDAGARARGPGRWRRAAAGLGLVCVLATAAPTVAVASPTGPPVTGAPSPAATTTPVPAAPGVAGTGGTTATAPPSRALPGWLRWALGILAFAGTTCGLAVAAHLEQPPRPEHYDRLIGPA